MSGADEGMPRLSRLVYLSASRLPSDTANSVHVMKMCAALARQGAAVTLVADRGHRGIRSEHNRTAGSEDPFGFYAAERSFELRLTPFSALLPYGLRHLARALYALWVVLAVRRRADSGVVVYARDTLGLSLARFARLPFAFEAHDLPHATRTSSRRNRLRAWLLGRLIADRRLVAVTCITQALESGLQQVEGVRLKGRSMVLPDAADIAEPCDAPALRPAGDVRVGYVGSLGAGKGIEVIEALARGLPDVRFELFGGRAEQLGPWRERLRDVPNLLLHGFVTQADIPCAYAQFDIALAPYQASVPGHRGDEIAPWMSPLKLFEYFAYGKAIVSSDLPVLREVLDDEVAVLVPPTDVDAWADVVHALLKDAPGRERLATAGRRRFEDHHTWDTRARRVLALFAGSGNQRPLP